MVKARKSTKVPARKLPRPPPPPSKPAPPPPPPYPPSMRTQGGLVRVQLMLEPVEATALAKFAEVEGGWRKLSTSLAGRQLLVSKLRDWVKAHPTAGVKL